MTARPPARRATEAQLNTPKALFNNQSAISVDAGQILCSAGAQEGSGVLRLGGGQWVRTAANLRCPEAFC